MVVGEILQTDLTPKTVVVPSPLPEAISSGKAPVSNAHLTGASSLYGALADPVPEFLITLMPNCSVPRIEALAVPPIAEIVDAPYVGVEPLIVTEYPDAALVETEIVRASAVSEDEPPGLLLA